MNLTDGSLGPMTNAPEYVFEVFRSEKNHRYYWHLKSKNNKIVASSAGDGYVEKRECLEGLGLTKNFASLAPVFWVSEDGKTENPMDLNLAIKMSQAFGNKVG